MKTRKIHGVTFRQAAAGIWWSNLEIINEDLSLLIHVGTVKYGNRWNLLIRVQGPHNDIVLSTEDTMIEAAKAGINRIAQIISVIAKRSIS